MRGLDEETLDAIREIVNIGVGRAAGQLQEMTGSHIRLRIPDISLLPVSEIRKLEDTYFKANILSAVQLDFKGTFSGVSVVIFPQESAAALVMLLTGENENSPEMDAIRIEALKEVGNIIMNAVMGSIANVLSEQLTYSLPAYYEGPLSGMTWLENKEMIDEYIMLARTNFLLESLNIEGDILLVLEIGSLSRLVESVQMAGSR